MPNGKYIPFDKGTNIQHRCQDSQSITLKVNGVAQETNIDGNVSIGNFIMQVVSESPGLKAKQIASIILRKYGVQVDRSEVNRWLYSDLKSKVYQDGAYQWFPGNTPIGGVPQSPSGSLKNVTPPDVRQTITLQDQRKNGQDGCLGIVALLLLPVASMMLIYWKF